jgi:non-canonical purine NTP pyrophosphatase (RdgB/HAM1 family)
MRWSALQNSIKTPIPAHLWHFKVGENCDALKTAQFIRLAPPPRLLWGMLAQNIASLGSFNECFGGLPLATTNHGKLNEYRQIFSGQMLNTVHLEIAMPPLDEHERKRWDNLMANGKYQQVAEEFSAKKAELAYNRNGGNPVVVEQSLLFIPHLGGWPGPDIVDLDSDKARQYLSGAAHEDRGAGEPGKVVVFTTLAVYTLESVVQFRHGELEGVITEKPQGSSGFSWDRIVRPVIDSVPSSRTFAEMHINEKCACSMRYLAVLALSERPFRLAIAG